MVDIDIRDNISFLGRSIILSTLFERNGKARRTASIMVPRVTAYCTVLQELLSASENCIAQSIALEKVLNRNTSRKAWDLSFLIGSLLSSCTIYLRISEKGMWRLSRNRTLFSLACPSAQDHVVNSRRSRRSATKHPRNMITLAAIALVVNLIPPSLVTSIDTK